MGLNVNLSTDAQNRLNAQAAALGLNPEDFAANLLEASLAAKEEHKLVGAQLVEYWRAEGIIGSRPDITDSVAHSRKLRRQAERRSK